MADLRSDQNRGLTAVRVKAEGPPPPRPPFHRTGRSGTRRRLPSVTPEPPNLLHPATSRWIRTHGYSGRDQACGWIAILILGAILLTVTVSAVMCVR